MTLREAKPDAGASLALARDICDSPLTSPGPREVGLTFGNWVSAVARDVHIIPGTSNVTIIVYTQSAVLLTITLLVMRLQEVANSKLATESIIVLWTRATG